MIFQLGGMSANLNLPPALVTWWSTPRVAPPFYKDPMVIGGVITILVSFAIKNIVIGYYKAKKQ